MLSMGNKLDVQVLLARSVNSLTTVSQGTLPDNDNDDDGVRFVLNLFPTLYNN
jgi:hypothetical protein